MTKILIDRATVEQALEALELAYDYTGYDTESGRELCREARVAAKALRAALAEPEQQPAGWLKNPFGSFRRNWLWRIDPPPQSLAWSIPLYAALPQRKEES